ncbi:MAG: formate dehydrogenase subunit gamma [Proteobacteria bacterium]|nr:formate dehydrogenase subunit gamma [Pseudomonadota bacterium]
MSERFWIRRYDDRSRMNHWFVVICFFLAALSGLAIFHPSMFFLASLFGGGQWDRILHPFFGVTMCLGFVGMALRFWHENRFTDADKQWMRQWRDVVDNREEKLPPVGRYNGGQKAIFWLMVICLIVLFVTGFMFWEPWFAPYVPLTLRRLAVLLHAATATVLIIGIIVHAYAAIWVKGSIGAMTRGYVSDRWARKHHAAWYREVVGRDPRA